MAASEPVYVFDACAVIALLKREPGFDVVLSLLETRANRCLLHAVNLCEVFYDLLRRDEKTDPAALESMLLATGFEVESRISAGIWQTAGRLKTQVRRIALADCFALALTLQEGGTLVTSDHHELDSVQATGVCPIRFIR